MIWKFIHSYLKLEIKFELWRDKMGYFWNNGGIKWIIFEIMETKLNGRACRSTWSHYNMSNKGETLPINSGLVGESNFPGRRVPRCLVLPWGVLLRKDFLMWEPVPMSLLPPPYSHLNTHFRIITLDLPCHSPQE